MVHHLRNLYILVRNFRKKVANVIASWTCNTADTLFRRCWLNSVRDCKSIKVQAYKMGEGGRKLLELNVMFNLL